MALEERLEDILEELNIAKENILSFKDNYIGGRHRKATADLYFGFEHTARALLMSIGVYPETHKGISRMLSYHFVKPGKLPVEIIIYLDNLYERRKTAEYSSKAGWEFTKEQIDIYRNWVLKGIKLLFDELLSRMEAKIRHEIEKIATDILTVLS